MLQYILYPSALLRSTLSLPVDSIKNLQLTFTKTKLISVLHIHNPFSTNFINPINNVLDQQTICYYLEGNEK